MPRVSRARTGDGFPLKRATIRVCARRRGIGLAGRLRARRRALRPRGRRTPKSGGGVPRGERFRWRGGISRMRAPPLFQIRPISMCGRSIRSDRIQSSIVQLTSLIRWPKIQGLGIISVSARGNAPRVDTRTPADQSAEFSRAFLNGNAGNPSTFVESAGEDGLAEIQRRGATRRSAKHRMFIERSAEMRPAVRGVLGLDRAE